MASLICTTHGTREERLNVIHNGFDFDSFAKPLLGPAEAKLLRSTVAASDEKIILFAGRLTSQKGIEALLASTARLLDEGLTARLVLAGEPDSHNSAKNIERLLDQFSALRRQITMLGRLPRKRLALLYQVADIAVVPSVYEPFGYAAVEAMTMGVPVVAADAGGLPEIIAHNQTGMLVPLLPNGSGKHTVDVAELASAESTLLRDDALRNRIGQTGKQHVAQVFNLETMSRRTLEVYRSMAATRPIRSFI
jgi:glycosyltransferase involved in cell wall biosynthesis